MLRILMRNTWAAKTAMEYLGADYIAPNELLSLGYRKNNQIKVCRGPKFCRDLLTFKVP